MKIVMQISAAIGVILVGCYVSYVYGKNFYEKYLLLKNNDRLPLALFFVREFFLGFHSLAGPSLVIGGLYLLYLLAIKV